MKSSLKCKTPVRAQVNFRKHQRTLMNRQQRRNKIYENFKET